MRSVAAISLLALISQSRAQDVGTQELVDGRRLQAKMFGRAMEPSFARYGDLDGTALGKTSGDEIETVPLDATRATKQVESLEEEIMTMRKDFKQALERGKANKKKGRWEAIAGVLKKFRPILMVLAAGGKGDWKLDGMKTQEALVAAAAAGVASTAAAVLAEARAKAAGGIDPAGEFEAIAKKAEALEGAATKIKDNLKDGLELRTARGGRPVGSFSSARPPTDVLSASIAALVGLCAGSIITVALLRLRRTSKVGTQPLLTA